MPVRRVVENGRVGYKWGNSGHTYFGRGAKEQAAKQGQAAYAAGYKKDSKR